MKLGTIVELPDGRRGTMVYHGLDGYGIKWGEHSPDPADFEGTHGNLGGSAPANWPWFPDAMLRDDYPAAAAEGVECVGDEYEVVFVPKEDDS